MIFDKKDKEKEDIKTQLNTFYNEANATIKNRREKWKKHYNYWVNKQLSKKRPAYKSDIRVNYCWVVTQIKAPVMTQNKPTVNFIAIDKIATEEERAKKLSQLIGNALWNKLEIQDTLSDVIFSGSVYDAGFWKIGFDPSEYNGIGEIFVESIEPFKLLIDPAAKKNIKDARYIIHLEMYPVSYLKTKFKRFAKHIKVDKSISDILFEGRKFDDRRPTATTITDSTEFSLERAFLKEFWLAPIVCDLNVMEKYEEEEEQTDELGNIVRVNVVKKRPKYRNGRVITVINDSLIVDDKPNPYDHGQFPFVKQIVNKVGNEFWGIGDIEQIIPLQDALNHAFQQIDDIATKTANVGWTADPSLGQKNLDKVASNLGIPGAMKIAPIGKIVADTPPQVPAYLIRRIDELISQIGIVSGITEIMQGLNPKHRTARGLERIFEAATTRIGQSVRFMEIGLKNVAYFMASVAQQYYTEERTYALIGSSGIATDTLIINPEDLKGEFEISIDSGASLPQDKQSRADLVFSLLSNRIFEMALSPDPALKEQARVVLDTVEFPGREKLLNMNIAPPPQAAQAAPQAAQAAQALPPAIPPEAIPPEAPPTAPPEAPPQLPIEVLEMLQTAGVNSPEEFLELLKGGQPII